MPESGAQFGEFILRREIGRGAMGTVWDAYQPSLDRTVALKVLAGATASDPTWVKRFKAEAGAVAKLSHSGILPVYGIGETDGQHWFAMELVEGEDLGQHLTESGPLAPRDAAKVIRHAAKALHHAHEHGVIHRDVKPANLMVRKDGRVTVTDFGLAKHIGSGALTTTGLLVGTPYYMSPELISAKGGQAVGPAADVYGLGVTLYELITGQPPFDAPNAMALLKQISEQDPKPPTQIDPKIPRDLETIALTCLRKRPERRYASAQDLADDLNRFLEHQPIAVSRPSPIERLTRFAQRNRMASGVAAAAFVVLLGAVLIFTNALRSQEEDYERRIKDLLSQADTLADAGDATAAETLYTEAEEISKGAPEARHHARQARAGRQFARLLRHGALEPEAVHGAAAWRNAPEGRVRIVTTPKGVTIEAQALRARGFEEDVPLLAEGGEIEPGLYRIELKAPGRVDSVVNLTAIPGMDTTIEVMLPEADETTAGMVAFLGNWRPAAQLKDAEPGEVDVRRHGRAFLLDAHSTTNAEYGAYLATQPDTERASLTPSGWSDGKPPVNALDEPVLGVTPEQGKAYAAWRGKRLPSSREFQTAVVPNLVMTVASLQQNVRTGLPGAPSGTIIPPFPDPRRPRAGRESPGAPPPEAATDIPPGAEVYHLELEASHDTIAKLRELRDTIRDAEGAASGPKDGVGPWTWEHRVRLGNPPPGMPTIGRMDPGLRLARDIE